MLQLGPYQLIERLGEGGMAEVYRARRPGYGGFERDFVLKLLHERLNPDPSFRKMLLEEAKLTASLRHPNIVPVLDTGYDTANDVLYVVLDYVDGKDMHASLAQAVRQGREFPISMALYIAREAAAGLHYAHTRNDEHGQPLQLVHRDVSLHNILVSYEGDVRLIDFGVAKIDSEIREKTRAGIIKGKFGYMSPEQAWDKTLDARSDVFSLGICLYEMLTGRSLYGQSSDMIAMLRKVREADIAPPSTFRPEISKRLDNVIMKALAPDPARRYRSAREFQLALSAIIAQLDPTLTPLDTGNFLHALFHEAVPSHPSHTPTPTSSEPTDQHQPDADPWHANANDRTEIYFDESLAHDTDLHTGQYNAAPYPDEEENNWSAPEPTPVPRSNQSSQPSQQSTPQNILDDPYPVGPPAFSRPRPGHQHTRKIEEHKIEEAHQRFQNLINPNPEPLPDATSSTPVTDWVRSHPIPSAFIGALAAAVIIAIFAFLILA